MHWTGACCTASTHTFTITYITNIKRKMTTEYVEAGPWGGKDGTREWPFNLERHWQFMNIKIMSDSECIRSIQFTTMNVITRDTNVSKPYGGDGGTTEWNATFDPDTEHLIEIGGTFGLFSGERVVITSLYFKTNKDKPYGPYGPGADQGDTPFSFPVHAGKVAGFFGKHGDRLDNLGVKLKPAGDH